MTTPGQLRELIKLQEREEIDDGAGNTVGMWVDRVTVPARIVFMKGGEEVLAGRLQGTQPVIATVRAGGLPAFGTDWRAVDARTNEAFAIRSIIKDERGAWVQVLCERGVAT